MRQAIFEDETIQVWIFIIEKSQSLKLF